MTVDIVTLLRIARTDILDVAADEIERLRQRIPTREQARLIGAALEYAEGEGWYCGANGVPEDRIEPCTAEVHKMLALGRTPS